MQNNMSDDTILLDWVSETCEAVVIVNELNATPSPTTVSVSARIGRRSFIGKGHTLRGALIELRFSYLYPTTTDQADELRRLATSILEDSSE